MTASIIRATTRALAIAGWLLFLFMTWYALAEGRSLTSGDVFQVDWHVYWAGAHDLIDRDLYRAPLDAAGMPLSASEFRLPPLSAAWPLPLLVVSQEIGGYLWQVVAAGSLAAAAVVELELFGVRRPWLWAGVALGPLAVTLVYLEGLHIGTNNYLVLALVAVGCRFYLRGENRFAGVLLGLAIATKLWPVTLLVVALRDRRWPLLGWAAGTALVQAALIVGWLGPDVLGPMLATLRLEIPPTGLLIGPTAIPGLRDLWNSGLGATVAIAILVLPLHGRLAVGAAILAGMAPIGNLWIHYTPTLLFGVALLVGGLTGGVNLPFSHQRRIRQQRPIAENSPT